MTHADLIARIERAGPEEQRELIFQTAQSLYGVSSAFPWPQFIKQLDAKAYLSAVMMMLPEEWDWAYRPTKATLIHKLDPALDIYGERAATPALALLAAILKVGEAK